MTPDFRTSAPHWATSALTAELTRIRTAVKSLHRPMHDRHCVTCQTPFPCRTAREVASPSLDPP